MIPTLPTDLIDWVICPELAVQQQAGQGPSGEFRDPYIWKEDDSWFMLICCMRLKPRNF